MSKRTLFAILDLRPDEQLALGLTVDAYINACNFAMQVGAEADTTGNAVIHRLCYRTLREEYGLSANLAIRAIASAARLLKQGVEQLSESDTAFVEYDTRTLTMGQGRVSMSSVLGRLKDIPFQVVGDRRLQEAVRYVLVRQTPAQFELYVEDRREV